MLDEVEKCIVHWQKNFVATEWEKTSTDWEDCALCVACSDCRDCPLNGIGENCIETGSIYNKARIAQENKNWNDWRRACSEVLDVLRKIRAIMMSIKHWEENLELTNKINTSATACALCTEYDGNCRLCPLGDCCTVGSIYDRAHKAYKKWTVACENMIAKLKELLHESN